ncbi:acyltransferase [Arcicella aquatica]|uniref:Acyltransferase n=1 Tax=Arcicella aquatica TaxID=217141 RepID=A0ABU5QIF2_9BACT|nr:acyltransferase [Arcicella aquatica]MEA5256827.1 acyltransferase [Arcicella aquatica]
MIKTRITLLDSFRALAILSVMLFHYFSRRIPPLYPVSLYPYNNDYDYFRWGYLGVEFFFIISGFVIFFTLDNTPFFRSFWKKRLMRLLPSMIIASVITYIIFNLFDTDNIFYNSHKIVNFIPSLTFIQPNLLNNLFSRFNVELHYLNDSYWSLWPELQFYFLSSTIYYFNKERFLKNFMLTSTILVVVNFIVVNDSKLNINLFSSGLIRIGLTPSFLMSYSKWMQEGFNLITYLPFFAIGVLFYSLFKNKQNNAETPLYIKIYLLFFSLFIIYSGVNFSTKAIYGGMFLLFFLFIYLPDKLAFFENKIVSDIGESSYFLYLIHENTGVLIIYSFGAYFSPFGWAFTLITILTLIALSNLYTFRIDKHLNRWLKKKLM